MHWHVKEPEAISAVSIPFQQVPKGFLIFSFEFFKVCFILSHFSAQYFDMDLPF